MQEDLSRRHLTSRINKDNIFPKKVNTTVCGEYRMLSLNMHELWILLRVLNKEKQKNKKERLGITPVRHILVSREVLVPVMQSDSCVCSEKRHKEHGKELNVCFVVYGKAFDRVDWAKNVLKDCEID